MKKRDLGNVGYTIFFVCNVSLTVWMLVNYKYNPDYGIAIATNFVAFLLVAAVYIAWLKRQGKLEELERQAEKDFDIMEMMKAQGYNADIVLRTDGRYDIVIDSEPITQEMYDTFDEQYHHRRVMEEIIIELLKAETKAGLHHG